MFLIPKSILDPQHNPFYSPHFRSTPDCCDCWDTWSGRCTGRCWRTTGSRRSDCPRTASPRAPGQTAPWPRPPSTSRKSTCGEWGFLRFSGEVRMLPSRYDTHLHSYSIPLIEIIVLKYWCSLQSSTGVRSPSLHCSEPHWMFLGGERVRSLRLG